MASDSSRRVTDEVRDYLDREMPGWREDANERPIPLDQAREIVQRYNEAQAMREAQEIVEWFHANDQRTPRRRIHDEQDANEIRNEQAMREAQEIVEWFHVNQRMPRIE